MRINELVTRADTIEHLRARAEKVAQLCDPIADKTLLFREFRTGINYETLLAKVVNQSSEGARGAKFVKKGAGGAGQTAILTALSIQNPVFVVMRVPDSTWGFHGDPHIFIPPPGAPCYWSPKIKDLGMQMLAGGEQLGKKKDKSGFDTTYDGVMAPQAKKWAATYVKEWPTTFTDHELIFDCEFYYLLNIKSFISKFVGKKNQSIVSQERGSRVAPRLNQELFNAKFKNYGNIAWYLRNTVPSYLDWFQKTYPLAK